MHKNKYTASELCKFFNLPADTIKRWAREFLPPDPIAKQAGGRPRIFNTDDAYTIFLARELIRVKKFSIPDTKKIIEDLKPWLLSKGQWPSVLFNSDKSYSVFIYKKTHEMFKYAYREEIDLKLIEHQGRKIYRELYFQGIVDMETDISAYIVDLDRYTKVGVTALALSFGSYLIEK